MNPLTEYIHKWHQENDRKPGDDAGAIHPSSLGDCNRRTIYKYLGVERDLEFNSYKQAMFFHGYRIEDWMSEALADQGLLIAKGVPVQAMYDGIPVEGTIDQIVRWPLENPDGWCIADTKSVSDYAFKHQSFPYKHHMLQVGTYQWGLGEMLKNKQDATGWLYDLRETWGDPPQDGWRRIAIALSRLQTNGYGPEYPPILFYIGRGNLKELGPVTAGDGAVDRALMKLAEVARYIKSEAYPPRPFETPEQHPYLCASCVRKGYQRSDGTYAKPLYKPNCSYFKRCWGVLPVEWNFWQEVKRA